MFTQVKTKKKGMNPVWKGWQVHTEVLFIHNFVHPKNISLHTKFRCVNGDAPLRKFVIGDAPMENRENFPQWFPESHWRGPIGALRDGVTKSYVCELLSLVVFN